MTTTQSKLQAARENAYEATARAKKVLAICEKIPHQASQEEVQRCADYFANLSWSQRILLAQYAGVNAPSETTWAEVIKALRKRSPVKEVV